MIFSTLKTRIQSLDEKAFYDIALLFLECTGYRDLSIVDGSGDGGRDVICSRSDLRIQLSIRKDWEAKINQEASNTRKAGKHHFIYVTNRRIALSDEQDFRANRYKEKGQVELTICDLNRIATALTHPGCRKEAYSQLGLELATKVPATLKEIAVSSLLLFSTEARELRESIIESHVKAFLFKNPGSTEETVMQGVLPDLPGADVQGAARAAMARLRQRNEIESSGNKQLQLSDKQMQFMAAAEEEYKKAIEDDLGRLTKYGLSKGDAERMIALALEIAAKEKPLDGFGPLEMSLLDFVSNHGLGKQRKEIYDDLSRMTVARVKQYGKTLDHIFAANTFDIYRALGRNTDVVLVLDASVSMPMIFGIAFRSAESSFGLAAHALKNLAEQHNIRLTVPRAYVNEMASHGVKALDFLDTYGALGEDFKDVLKSSRNAYLSHFSHIRQYEKVTLEEFLAYFGLVKSAKLYAIENRIESILDSFGIEVTKTVAFDDDVRRRVVYEKAAGEDTRIIDHDASVATQLRNDTGRGFVLATWDRSLIAIVEDIARVYADTPARVVDFLSMATGAQYESDHSYSLLTALTYADEGKLAGLANKIEKLNSVVQAHEFQKFIDSERKNRPATWSAEAALDEFFIEAEKKSKIGSV